MRSKNINQVISYKDVKPGDKVRVSGELEIKDIRIAEDSPRLGKSAIVNVKAPTGDGEASWVILESDTVTLLERDEEIRIPDDALIVHWQDVDDYDYYARKVDGGKWTDSEHDDHGSADALIQAILDEDFDEYKFDSFEVIKTEEPKFTPYPYAMGGVVHGGSLTPNPFAAGGPVNLSAASIHRLSNAVLGGVVR